MATKPTTLPRIWAQNTNYVNGPFVGSIQKVDPGPAAAEGHRPGSAFPTPAEWQNYQQYWEDVWIVDWLALGSSAGAADAHIVETDSTGRSRIHGVTVQNGADEIALVVAGAPTTQPVTQIIGSSDVTALKILGQNATDATVEVTCLTGAAAIQAKVDNGGTAIFVDLDGAGPFATGLFASVGADGGRGFSIQATGNTLPASIISMTANATTDVAPGLLVSCFLSSDDGIKIQRDAGTGVGLRVVTDDAAPGILVESTSATDPCVEATNSSGGNVFRASTGVSSASCYLADIGNGPGSGFTASVGTGGGRALDVVASLYVLPVNRIALNSNNTVSGTAPGLLIEASNVTDVMLRLVRTGLAGGRGLDISYTTNGVAARIESTLNNAGARGIDIITNGGVGIDIATQRNFCLDIGTGVGEANPTTGTLRMKSQLNRPVSAVAGQLTYHTTEGYILQNGDGWRGLWSSDGGGCLGIATQGSETNISGVGNWYPFATASATGGNAPRTGGRTTPVRVTLEAASFAGAGTYVLNVRIFDVTLNSVVASYIGPGTGLNAGFQRRFEGGGWEHTISFVRLVPVPTSGTRTLRLDVQSSSGAQLGVRNASIDFIGLT